MKNKIVSAREAVSIIKSGDTIAVSGNVEMLVPDLILKTLEKMFLSRSIPKYMNLFYPVMPCSQHKGIGMYRLAHKGMLVRVIASSFLTMKVEKIFDLIRKEVVDLRKI